MELHSDILSYMAYHCLDLPSLLRLIQVNRFFHSRLSGREGFPGAFLWKRLYQRDISDRPSQKEEIANYQTAYRDAFTFWGWQWFIGEYELMDHEEFLLHATKVGAEKLIDFYFRRYPTNEIRRFYDRIMRPALQMNLDHMARQFYDYTQDHTSYVRALTYCNRFQTCDELLKEYAETASVEWNRYNIENMVMWSSESGHVEMMRLAQKYGQQHGFIDYGMYSDIAVQKGHLEILRLIWPAFNLELALIEAIRCHQPHIVDYLCSLRPQNLGWAMHEAAFVGNLGMMWLLHRHGAPGFAFRTVFLPVAYAVYLDQKFSSSWWNTSICQPAISLLDFSLNPILDWIEYHLIPQD